MRRQISFDGGKCVLRTVRMFFGGAAVRPSFHREVPMSRRSAAARAALLCLTLCGVGFSVVSATAASLQVAPVSLEIPAATKASQITLQNFGDMPIDVQVRVFRWTQVNGEEQLTPTEDVVASPPAASLVAGQEYLVRLVRVAAAPVVGEETYRLLVDELPRASADPASRINFVVRYSIPIFYAQPDSRPLLAWSAVADKDQVRVTVRNTGARHVRIAALNVEDSLGATLSYGQGLVGYVLGHSTMTWTARNQALAPGSSLKITAQGDNGPLSATAVLEAAAD
jgi:fimbrial chaperone protein